MGHGSRVLRRSTQDPRPVTRDPAPPPCRARSLIVHPPSIRRSTRNRTQLAPVRQSAAHGEPAYRCFLPNLAGFTGVPLRRTRPSTPLTPVRPSNDRPRAGVQPRYSGLRVQGTASSPSSTTLGSPKGTPGKLSFAPVPDGSKTPRNLCLRCRPYYSGFPRKRIVRGGDPAGLEVQAPSNHMISLFLSVITFST